MMSIKGIISILAFFILFNFIFMFLWEFFSVYNSIKGFLPATLVEIP
jgi:hypothetical protein